MQQQRTINLYSSKAALEADKIYKNKKKKKFNAFVAAPQQCLQNNN